LGSLDRTIKSANVETGSKIELANKKLTVSSKLELIATQNKSAAPIQGGGSGTLEFASGATFQADLSQDKSAYQLAAGGTTPVYFADGLANYTPNGASVATTPNRLFRVEGNLQFSGSSLFFNIKRNFAKELFPLVSTELTDLIDNYDGSNDWIETMMTNENDDDVIGQYVQGGLDIANVNASATLLYSAQSGVNDIMLSRSRHFVSHTKYLTLGQCDPCEPCDSNGYGILKSNQKREFYVTPIYGNNRGFRLQSGGYKYGYVNDQWALGVGVDQSSGRKRVGMLGVYGEGQAATRSILPRTINDSKFGGLFFYANTGRGDVDILFTTGYLGSENSIEQKTTGNAKLRGTTTTGLASLSAILTRTLQYGNIYVLPNLGIEYGYYHQGAMAVRYNNNIVLRNSKSHTNIATVPVGVKFTYDCNAFNGLLSPEFRARYIGNIGGVTAKYNTFLIGSPSSALMATKMTDRSAGDIGLGFSWKNHDTKIRSDVGYLFSKHYSDLSVSVTAEWRF
jgi:hypothetical protein